MKCSGKNTLIKEVDGLMFLMMTCSLFLLWAVSDYIEAHGVMSLADYGVSLIKAFGCSCGVISVVGFTQKVELFCRDSGLIR